MNPDDFYFRMMGGIANMNAQQQQAANIASMRAAQQHPPIPPPVENNILKTPKKFEGCEIVDAEFEFIPDDNKRLEKL